MALIAYNASDTTTTTGTGAVTLSGVASATPIIGTSLPNITFATGFTNNGSISYPIANVGYQISDGTNTETGLGTLTSATNLTRDLVLTSSNGGRHVNFIAGTKAVTSSSVTFYLQAGSWTSTPPTVLPENDIQSGTFSGFLNAGTAAPVSIVIRYKVSGAGQAVLSIPTITQTSVATTAVTITGIPAFLSPQSVANVVGLVTNSAVVNVGVYSFAAGATVQGTGTATLSAGVAPPGAFTSATGVNGTSACVVAYDLF